MTDIWVRRTRFAAAVILLSLAGCAATEPAAEAPAHGEADAETVVYPVGFPKTAVPLFDGTLLHFAHPGNLWAAWVESKDLVADLATASQLLIDAGYTQTVTADGWAEFTSAERSLRIVASVDADWGSSLMYTFTDDAIEAADAVEQDAAEAEAPADH